MSITFTLEQGNHFWLSGKHTPNTRRTLSIPCKYLFCISFSFLILLCLFTVVVEKRLEKILGFGIVWCFTIASCSPRWHRTNLDRDPVVPHGIHFSHSEIHPGRSISCQNQPNERPTSFILTCTSPGRSFQNSKLGITSIPRAPKYMKRTIEPIVKYVNAPIRNKMSSTPPVLGLLISSIVTGHA